MRLSRLIALPALAITLAALPAVAPAQASTTNPGIQRWLNDFKQAFEARDTKAVMALYTPDVLAYDIVPPLQYNGADAYGKDFADYFSHYKGPLHLEFRDLRVHTSGDLALITCLEYNSGTLTNGKRISIWLRDTTALRRVNGHWLDFHDHVSVPVDMDTGKARMDLQP